MGLLALFLHYCMRFMKGDSTGKRVRDVTVIAFNREALRGLNAMPADDFI